MKLSVSNGIKLLLKRVYQKFTNGSRTKKSTPKGVSPLSVLLLFPLIVKYKKHNYFWMGGVSIISGTLFRVRREPFPTSKITMLIINVCCLHLYYTIYFRHCQFLTDATSAADVIPKALRIPLARSSIWELNLFKSS